MENRRKREDVFVRFLVVAVKRMSLEEGRIKRRRKSGRAIDDGDEEM